MVDVMRAGSLYLSDPVTDQQRWRDTHDQVYVILNTPNCVEVQTRCLESAVFKEVVQMLLNGTRQNRRVIFGVPDEMKVDLRIDTPRHEVPPWLKLCD
jgi:hypothetical protein